MPTQTLPPPRAPSEPVAPSLARRPRVLVLSDWFAPGFRAGGIIRSVVHFAEQLEDALDIHILTSDRDLGDTRPYAGIEPDCWLPRSRHRVFYASPGQLRWDRLARTLRALEPDHIYLNSLYSRPLAICPLLLHWAGVLRAPLLLAPHGMLGEAAMGAKPLRKRAFIGALRATGIPARIRFHATDENEAADVQGWFGPGMQVVCLGDLPRRVTPFEPPPPKVAGHLRLAFVGRSHPIKNLDFLLRVLAGVRARVELTAAVAREDEGHAQLCRALAAQLPSNVTVRYLEDVPHEAVQQVLRECHLVALPSQGENFGHAVFEAMATGRPVLVSDRTPWRGLAKTHAGWDLPLGDAQAFRDTLEAVAAMDAEALLPWCRGAWERARAYAENPLLRQAYADLFP
jgi:glycosyltransferase involved in cell wall biosynthesis